MQPRLRPWFSALPVLVAFLAFLAAGCGGADSAGGGSARTTSPAGAPDAASLIADSVEAIEAATSAHYVLNAAVAVEASGEVSDPTLSALAENPIELLVEGDVSEDALTANGSLTFLGQTFTAELMGSEGELFLNFMGAWYGTTNLSRSGAEHDASVREKFKQDILDRFDQVLAASVVEGPDVDGAATWSLEGHLNADGLASLAEEHGRENVPSEMREALATIAEAFTVVMLVGREDSLPRRVELHLDLRGDELRELGGSGANLDGLDSLRLDIAVDLSAFGTSVSYDPPSDYRPLEELIGQLFLGFGQALSPAA